jgi:hypothetical protein
LSLEKDQETAKTNAYSAILATKKEAGLAKSKLAELKKDC